MKYLSRFFLYAPLAAFLALAIGVGVVWWRQADALSDQLDALNGHEAMPGVTLRFASKSIGGFPFNMDVVFTNLQVEVKTPHGPSRWTSQKFALHALTYGRAQMIFEAAGHQQLAWTDLKGGAHAMPFEVGELHASAIAGERGLSRFDLDCIGFGSPALTAGRAQLHARVAPDGRSVDLAFAADVVRLSPASTSLLGPEITTVRLNANVAPGQTLDGLRAGRTDWVSAAETFRNAGGALRVSDLEITWPKMSAMGKGQLSLDGSHAVEGLIDFKVAGMSTLVRMAQLRGVQGGANGGIAAALLDRAAKAGSNDAGLMGAVLGFHGGAVSLGDEAATTQEPLY